MTDLRLPDTESPDLSALHPVTDLHAELADIDRWIAGWRFAERYFAPRERKPVLHLKMAELRAELGAARRRIVDAIASDATSMDFEPGIEI